ncbi:CRIB domain-containing protein RIC4-like [Nicotiana tabacum]|uniref:CRIB domain-containing protein RIC4-like n=1 Tax=Nicotiana tabacum TaxID=4097 RepID=A0A1S4CXW2_TOBAC|nr:CRIB domain-containing protein RIC4-like [Nicotiana tomentosiformis]XP_016505978.1 PREDICTED: CRIB domain-containing protein RIC4-like [Nicotiana tabacum]
MLSGRNMKEKSIEKFFMLPFSVVCGSESSVAVSSSSSQSEKTKTNPAEKTKRLEGEESSSSVKMKSFWGFLAMTRPTFSQNIRRLKRHFKGFSQLFVHKEEEEEVEMEIEIGYPTDVKHVTHIGWDGSTTINPIKGWENLKTPELISFPSISIKQFELAMAAQAGGPVDVNNNHCA